MFDQNQFELKEKDWLAKARLFFTVTNREIMKTFVTTAAIVLVAAATYAADDKPSTMQNGMMQGDMMKDCPMMKDRKMKEGMSKDMMAQCHKMIKGGGMMKDKSSEDTSDDNKPSGISEEDHKKHHPAIEGYH